ncbi:cytochrome P450 [Streptomyces sp. CAU 1734]|uniref:cytochrome P450 family protein n=1 Tax=Streptomyces sp. CAU 1734 TaxID=3140360 RepID=UPI00325FF9EC
MTSPHCPGTGSVATLESAGGARMYEQVDRLRKAGPAVRVRLPEDVVAWSVTRGDVVKRLLTHPGVSRDPRKSVPGYRPGAVNWLFPWVDVESMFTSEGQDHTRLRKLIAPAFAPRRIEAMRPLVEAIVGGLLDALEKRPADEPVDLRAEFVYPVPTRVICDLFGVPDGQRPEMLRVAQAVADTGASVEEAAVMTRDLIAGARRLIGFKRRNPGDDMTSLLLTTRAEDADRLSEEELLSTLLLMIGAGSQTAIALIGNAVRELLLHRDRLDAALAGAEPWSGAVEETLRLHPPVMHMPLRWATQDIDLGEGVVIRAGETMIIAFGAHGRDPGVHGDPEVFDPRRADKEHLAFGHGVHYCLGAALGRLEAEVALPALFGRFPRLALAGGADGIEPQRSFIGNDVTALPVVLGEAARTAG